MHVPTSHYIWVALGLSVLFPMGPFGCAEKSLESKLLLDARGRERTQPSMWLFERLRTSSAPEAMTRDIVRQLESGEGLGTYSQLACCFALLKILQDGERREVVDARAIRALALRCLKLGGGPGGPLVGEDSLSEKEGLWVSVILDPRIEKGADCYRIRMEDGLLRDWRAKDVRVSFDGEVVFASKKEYGLYGALEAIPVRRLLGSRLFGKHVRLIECVIIAPNGVEVPIREELPFQVKTTKEVEEQWLNER